MSNFIKVNFVEDAYEGVAGGQCILNKKIFVYSNMNTVTIGYIITAVLL